MKNLQKGMYQVVLVVLFLGSWTSYSYAMDLVTQQITNNDSNDIYPQVSGPYAVWEWNDPNDGDSEIIYYDSENIIQLTDNASDDINPQIFGRKVVWQGWDPNEGDWEIFYFDGHSIQQLTNDEYDDVGPKISNELIIWEGWDGNDWEIETAKVPVPAGMKVTPQTLNLKSKGKWITVHLTVPTGMKRSQVDRSSLLLMGQVPVSKMQSVEGSSRKLALKFERKEVQALLTTGSAVEIYLTGQMYDGTVIEGSSTIKVINPTK